MSPPIILQLSFADLFWLLRIFYKKALQKPRQLVTGANCPLCVAYFGIPKPKSINKDRIFATWAAIGGPCDVCNGSMVNSAWRYLKGVNYCMSYLNFNPGKHMQLSGNPTGPHQTTMARVRWRYSRERERDLGQKVLVALNYVVSAPLVVKKLVSRPCGNGCHIWPRCW